MFSLLRYGPALSLICRILLRLELWKREDTIERINESHYLLLAERDNARLHAWIGESINQSINPRVVVMEWAGTEILLFGLIRHTMQSDYRLELGDRLSSSSHLQAGQGT